jgi:hypothetical protein
MCYCVVSLGKLEGKTIEEGWQKFKAIFLSTWLAGLSFWPIIQYANQSYIPLDYRTLFMDACSFTWDMYYSAKIAITKKPEREKGSGVGGLDPGEILQQQTKDATVPAGKQPVNGVI